MNLLKSVRAPSDCYFMFQLRILPLAPLAPVLKIHVIHRASKSVLNHNNSDLEVQCTHGRMAIS